MPDLVGLEYHQLTKDKIKPSREVTSNPCKVTWFLDIGDQADSNHRFKLSNGDIRQNIGSWRKLTCPFNYKKCWQYLEGSSVWVLGFISKPIFGNNSKGFSYTGRKPNQKTYYSLGISSETNSRRNLALVGGGWSKIIHLGLEIGLWPLVIMTYWSRFITFLLLSCGLVHFSVKKKKNLEEICKTYK